MTVIFVKSVLKVKQRHKHLKSSNPKSIISNPAMSFFTGKLHKKHDAMTLLCPRSTPPPLQALQYTYCVLVVNVIFLSPLNSSQKYPPSGCCCMLNCFTSRCISSSLEVSPAIFYLFKIKWHPQAKCIKNSCLCKWISLKYSWYSTQN